MDVHNQIEQIFSILSMLGSIFVKSLMIFNHIFMFLMKEIEDLLFLLLLFIVSLNNIFYEKVLPQNSGSQIYSKNLVVSLPGKTCVACLLLFF